MKKSEAVNKLNVLKDRAEPLKNLPRKNQEFQKWQRDTEVAIEHIFGIVTRHSQDFKNIRYSLRAYSNLTPDYEFEKTYQNGISTAITVLESFISEIEEYWTEEEVEARPAELGAVDKVKLLINRFHQVSCQLRDRYSDRPPIEIEDEYDIQYLFHALLKLFFDDVRAEEYTPSYAGAASRVDFLLKQERLVIEIKKLEKGWRRKRLASS